MISKFQAKIANLKMTAVRKETDILLYMYQPNSGLCLPGLLYRHRKLK